MKNQKIEKNILDLKHQVNLAKAVTFLGLAISSWTALFFGIKQFYHETLVIFFIATFIAFLLLFSAFKFFKNCERIHEEVKNLEN